MWKREGFAVFSWNRTEFASGAELGAVYRAEDVFHAPVWAVVILRSLTMGSESADSEYASLTIKV